MNLVQMAEQAKNLSNQQLQMMLQRPDGAIPPFILASEAARRQDVERSAQASQAPQSSTVLDDLIQQRTAAAGVNTLPAQAVQPQQPQQARDGGIMGIRRFSGIDGSYVSPFSSDLGAGGLDYEWNPDFGASEEGISQGISEAINPNYWNQVKKDEGIGGISTMDSAKKYVDDRESRSSRTWRLNSEAEARKKNEETEIKKTDMGDVPVTAEELRNRLKSIYAADTSDQVFGVDGSAYADAAAALVDNTPNRTSWQRWANAIRALSANHAENARDSRDAERELAKAEWGFDKDERDKRVSAEVAAAQLQREGWKEGSAAAKDQATEARERMSAIAAKYKVDPNAMIVAAVKGETVDTNGVQMSPEDKAELAQLSAIYRNLMAQSGAFNQKFMESSGINPSSIGIYSSSTRELYGLPED